MGGRTVELDLEVFTFDIDFAGHVSNITYIRWLEIGRLQLLSDAGLPVTMLLEQGLAPVLTRTEIDYKWPLRLGDPVHLSLWMEQLRAASAILRFEITSGSRLAATARQAGLFVRTATGRPHRLAPELRARFEPFVRVGGPPGGSGSSGAGPPGPGPSRTSRAGPPGPGASLTWPTGPRGDGGAPTGARGPTGSSPGRPG